MVPFSEAAEFIGVRSRTTLYKLIRLGDLPEPIRRGPYNFFLQSDLTAYTQRLAASRGSAAQAQRIEANRSAISKALDGKAAKRAAHSQRSEAA